MGVWQMKVAGEADRERRMQQPRLTRYAVRARSIGVTENRSPNAFIAYHYIVRFIIYCKTKKLDIIGIPGIVKPYNIRYRQYVTSWRVLRP